MAESKLISKVVGQELKRGQVVASATRHYSGMQAQWAALLGVKGAAALATLLKELAPRIEEAGAALEHDEQALGEERQDDEAPRTARDEASEALNQTLIKAKGLVSSTFGEQALITYGLSGTVPSGADTRRSYARNAANLLRKNPDTTHDLLGRPTSTEDIALLIEQSAAPLDVAVAADTREALELNDALIKRDAARGTLRELTEFSGQLLDGSLRLIAQDSAADKLTTRLRARRRADGEEGDPTDEPMPELEPIAQG
jgi:hypothetical protein